MSVYLLLIMIISLACFILFLSYGLTSGGPTLEVSAGSGQHPINPDIYGINFANDELLQFSKEIKLPFDRWGGNAVTRYNWKNDMSNHASDWFFENIAEENQHPEKLPDGSKTDTFIEKDRSIGARTMITLPLIGWTPKDREKRCGFSVKKYGPQQRTDQWAPECGNGVHTDGKPVTGNDPKDTSVPVNASFAKEWVQHLVKKYGKASAGGVRFYQMDNEYDLWHSTHRDVRPTAVGSDEILKLTEEYASAVKQVDPSAQILGLVGWGLLSLLQTGLGNDDKARHGNVDFAAYYLKTLKQYQDQHKTRLIDYIDCHIYPQPSNVVSDSSDPNVNAVRLRSTRSLWDTTYVDESWIKDLGPVNSKIEFIPRMRNYVNQNYPGTKLAVTEYNWGGLKTINGALTQADILGIFGREGLDLASLWGPGKPNEPWAYAYRIFRNYDGKGSQFGDTSVTAKSSDQQQLAIYASTRSHDKKLIIVVINKEPNTAIDSKIAINGFNHSGTAKVFTYSSANLSKIVESTTKVESKALSYKFPAYSITLFEI